MGVPVQKPVQVPSQSCKSVPKQNCTQVASRSPNRFQFRHPSRCAMWSAMPSAITEVTVEVTELSGARQQVRAAICMCQPEHCTTLYSVQRVKYKRLEIMKCLTSDKRRLRDIFS